MAKLISEIARIILRLPKPIDYTIQLDKCPYDGELRHDCENCTKQFSLPLCAYEEETD